jgi:hypothetical protein
MRTLRLIVLPLALALGLALAPSALAGGGRYAFDGGSERQRAQVKAALDASAFDWGLVPGVVTIHLRSGGPTAALPGDVFIDADVLSAGMFAWAVVQDEYAHQVDFRLLDAGKRALLTERLGATAWCRDDEPGLAHARYGCERFASTLVWAYWQSPENAYRPASPADESAAMEPGRFRSLLGSLIGAAEARTLHSRRSKARR